MLGGCTSARLSGLQETVDAFRSLQPTSIPEHLEEYNCVKTGEEFDMNDYFTVLAHLSMEEGYVLDYVYLYDWGFGGRPVIYVREVNRDPFLNYEEFNEAMELEEQVDDVYEFVSLVMYGDDIAFDNKIRIDGTKEGFFEYVVLQLMGGQFYLYWHALYDDATIICDETGLEEVLEELSDWDDVDDLEPTQISDARKLTLQPIVEFKGDIAIVTVIVFTKWGGFIRDSFTISRDYPHTIIDRSWKVIIEYECGISF